MCQFGGDSGAHANAIPFVAKSLQAGLGQLREGPSVDRLAKVAVVGATSRMTKSPFNHVPWLCP